MLGELRIALRGSKLPRPGDFRPQVDYGLPFPGEWLVANGGTTPATSHSWDLLSQRYAYDFVVIDADGCTHRAQGKELGDYYAYAQPILAPADGIVVRVRDGIRDAPRVGTGWVDWRSRDIAGNAVTIRHAPGEYSHLAHLMPGGIAVSEGEQVRRGQVIGRCGNSGRSTEPHLHFQVQDRDDFLQAISLPVKFCGVSLVDSAGAPVDFLEPGIRVRSDPAIGDCGRSADALPTATN